MEIPLLIALLKSTILLFTVMALTMRFQLLDISTRQNKKMNWWKPAVDIYDRSSKQTKTSSIFERYCQLIVTDERILCK